MYSVLQVSTINEATTTPSSMGRKSTGYTPETRGERLSHPNHTQWLWRTGSRDLHTSAHWLSLAITWRKVTRIYPTRKFALTGRIAHARVLKWRTKRRGAQQPGKQKLQTGILKLARDKLVPRGWHGTSTIHHTTPAIPSDLHRGINIRMCKS